ncbi:GTPase required for pre-60S ribosomal subunit nuclear export and maturation, partial [Spiromyces aspiralis]
MGKAKGSGGSAGLGNLKMKGENFYRDKAKLRYLNMLKSGKAVRDSDGKVIKAAPFQSSEAKIARIEPNRRWFGNTRVIGQKALEDFREQL